MRRLTALTLAAACMLLVAGPVRGDDTVREKKQVDAKIDRLEDKIADARAHEEVLTEEISAVTSRIRGLQDDVDLAAGRLDRLEVRLALQQSQLDKLNALYGVQTKKLVFLQRQHKEAIARLNKRLVDIYTADSPNPLSVVLEAATFSELLDQLEFLNDIGKQDDRIAGEVAASKLQMQETRNRTRATRARSAALTAEVAHDTNEQRAVRDRLQNSQRALADARRLKRDTLDSVQHSKEEYLQEVEGLLATSAELSAKIQSAQSASASSGTPRPPSSSGLIWPAGGPVTSGFGWRWGRMHEGIDVGIPSGTPLVAAASGIVIHAGWMGGYGNLVVIDHGNGLSTAYGHNTSVAVSAGQAVSQGQLISYSGNTGNSTGPHLHFEVRVNGSAVDPLGYL
jgi:murein DD-endopeptidase MepM/ murein hydrolase activator NlpD